MHISYTNLMLYRSAQIDRPSGSIKTVWIVGTILICMFLRIFTYMDEGKREFASQVLGPLQGLEIEEKCYSGNTKEPTTSDSIKDQTFFLF